MPAILYCTRCAVGFGVVGTIPPICPACGKDTSWTSSPAGPWPFPLSQTDRDFLRVNKIAKD